MVGSNGTFEMYYINISICLRGGFLIMIIVAIMYGGYTKNFKIKKNCLEFNSIQSHFSFIKLTFCTHCTFMSYS